MGNVLSLKVFCSTKVPRTSSRTYLIALSIFDGIFLLTHFIDSTCKEIVEHYKLDFPINITDQKQTMCKSFVLLRNTCRAASPWIIVAFTLERFLVVNFPHHSSIISKPILAKRFIIIIIIMSVLVSLYAPILSGVALTPNSLYKRISRKISTVAASATPLHMPFFQQEKFFKRTCDVLAEYRSLYIYLTVFYTTVVIILPLIIISVFNAVLIARLYRSTDQWTTAKLELHEQEMSYKELRDKKVQIENLKITWTLIIISLTFIFLTLPHVIMYFVSHSATLRKGSKTKQNVIMSLQKITELFYIFNHSINFFLYIVTRNSFRRVLKEKLKCDCMSWKDVSKGNNLSLFQNCTMAAKPDSSNTGARMSATSDENAIGLIATTMPDVAGAGDQDNKISDKLQPENYENYWEMVTNKSITTNSVETVVTSEAAAAAAYGKRRTLNNNKKGSLVDRGERGQSLKFDMLKKKNKI